VQAEQGEHLGPRRPGVDDGERPVAAVTTSPIRGSTCGATGPNQPAAIASSAATHRHPVADARAPGGEDVGRAPGRQ
jgi:hypothetical protein